MNIGGIEDFCEKHDEICNLTFFDIDSDGKQELIVSSRVAGNVIEHTIGKWGPKGFTWKTGSTAYFPYSWTKTVSEIIGDFRGNGTLQYIPLYQEQSVISKIRGCIKMTNDNAVACLISEASGDFPSLKNIKETEGRFAVADVNGQRRWKR